MLRFGGLWVIIIIDRGSLGNAARLAIAAKRSCEIVSQASIAGTKKVLLAENCVLFAARFHC